MWLKDSKEIKSKVKTKNKNKTIKIHAYISTFIPFLTLLAWFTLKQTRKRNLSPYD